MVKFSHFAILVCFISPAFIYRPNKVVSSKESILYKWRQRNEHNPDWLEYLQIALTKSTKPDLDVIGVKKVVSAKTNSGSILYNVGFTIKKDCRLPDCEAQFELPSWAGATELKLVHVICAYNVDEVYSTRNKVADLNI